MGLAYKRQAAPFGGGLARSDPQVNRVAATAAAPRAGRASGYCPQQLGEPYRPPVVDYTTLCRFGKRVGVSGVCPRTSEASGPGRMAT